MQAELDPACPVLFHADCKSFVEDRPDGRSETLDWMPRTISSVVPVVGVGSSASADGVTPWCPANGQSQVARDVSASSILPLRKRTLDTSLAVILTSLYAHRRRGTRDTAAVARGFKNH